MVRGWLQARNAPAPGAVEDRTLPRENVPAAMIPYASGNAPALNADAALRIGDVYAVVRAMASTAASLPLHTYRRGPDGGRERFTGRLADLLAQPSPGTTTAGLVGTMMTHVLLTGDAFVGLYRDQDGRVVQLAPLHPATVSVTLENGEPTYVLTRPSGVSRHGREDILHIRGALSLDGLTGASPIALARQALGLADALATHASSFASNAGRPGGLITLKDGLDPGGTAQENLDRSQQLAVDFQNNFTRERSGLIAVVTGELEFHQLSLTMADAQFIEQRQLSTVEVCRLFGCPPWIVGAASPDSLTYANAESQSMALVKYGLQPHLTVIEQALSAHPDLAPKPVYASFNLDALLRADSKTRAETYALALDPDRGWLTRAEVRELEDMPAELDPPTQEAPNV